MFRRFLLLLAFAASATHAHPELEDALARINAALAAEPGCAELFLERGELYARHQDWPAAEANYLRAAELAPDLPGLDRARGALALATGERHAARRCLDRAIARDPRDAEALILRSRARAAAGERVAALADLEAALPLIAEARTELFLERAALCASPLAALRGLDAAIARLGPAHTLQLRALELEEALGLFDAALARVDALIAASERRDPWLRRRGEILARAGRDAEARAAYSTALAEIERLPAWLRDGPAAAEDAAELRRRLDSFSHAQ